MNLWDFFHLLGWNPVTRKLAAVLFAAAALVLAYSRINYAKEEASGAGAGLPPTPASAPEAKTPARRQRRRRRSSAANSPNGAANAGSASSSSSLESNTAPGTSVAQSPAVAAADPSPTKSAPKESHSERAVSPSVSAEPVKGADQEEQLPRTSLCGCRVLKKGEPIPDTEAVFDASKRPVIGETSPVVDYKQWEPLRLCDPILDRKTEVTPASKRPPAVLIEQSYLTPFQSILQSLEFADKHAYLIESLVDNYEWLQ